MSTKCIALLGRRDEPTDAIEEYCHYLDNALRSQCFQLEIRRVPWEICGWPDALHALELQAERWRGTWVLVQYTALAWSRRGFSWRVLRVLKILKSAGARVGIVFHDVEPYMGSRLVDSVRRTVQIRTMRRILTMSNVAVFTVPLERVSWLAAIPSNATFIPVGPNLPIPFATAADSAQHPPTIGVFSITGGQQGARETEMILGAVRHASLFLGELRLSVFGRHAELREGHLRAGLKDLSVELSVDGVIEPKLVVQKLSACDVLLFVRGGISSRRSSAIAGIACGLPVIAFPGSETAPPITDAGVVLVPVEEPEQLNRVLVSVLSDAEYRAALAARSRAAYRSHFTWPSIAARFCAMLNKMNGPFN